MNLTEIKERYVIELHNKPTIKSQQTINSYTSVFNRFCLDNSRFYRLNTNELKKYMSEIRVNYSESYYNVFGSVLKIVYEDVLKQGRKMKWFKPVKTYPKFQNIISVSEFIAMGKRCRNSKHKLIHVFLYSTGVRLSELINVKIEDIDFFDKRIFIHSAKNGKNRYLQLHHLLERYIKIYLQEWRPEMYILNGQKSLKYSTTSIQKIINRISNGKYHPHSYRHTYLTNLIEHENVFAAKDAAGHNNLNSTLHYYHLSKQRLKKMYNPLNNLKTA